MNCHCPSSGASTLSKMKLHRWRLKKIRLELVRKLVHYVIQFAPYFIVIMVVV